MDIVSGVIGALSLIVVAVLERRSRRDDAKWETNHEEHEALVARIETMGSGLGRSLDRVEQVAIRTEEKLDQHINDHVTGKLVG